MVKKDEVESDALLFTHIPYLSDAKAIGIQELKMGDIIKFNYQNKEYTVMVIKNDYHSHLHGLSLQKINRTTLIDDVINKIQPKEEPLNFYARVLNTPELIELDAYRTYKVRQIVNLRKMNYKTDTI